MAFATAADLALLLQRTVDTPTANLALDLATSIIQGETGQTLTLVNNDVVTFNGGEPVLYLPQGPVVSVGAVTGLHYGSPVTTYVLNTDYTVRGHRLVWRGSGGWPYSWTAGGTWLADLVTVTYTHGYATIPDDIRGACLALAADLYANPEGLTEERIDDYSSRREPGSEAASALGRVVRRYRRGGRVGSVRIG